MSLKRLEARWKPALTSILEELDDSQYLKLMNWLEKIPQGVKNSKVRGDMPQIIIQYYGVEESISLLDKALNFWIPRKDAAVQTLLMPIVEKMKSERQKKAKGKKTKTAGEVLQKAAEDYPQRSSQTSTIYFNPTEAVSTSGIKRKADGAAAVKPKSPKVERKNKPTETIKPVKADPDAPTPPQQVKLPPNKDPSKPSGAAKPAKASSAPVKSGRIQIIAVKSTNKTNTHLVVRLKKELLEVFITTRLLLETFGFKPYDDVKEQIQGLLPLSADAIILGNKISELKKA
ncbi:uncharacterized protein KZ484_018511 isoform 1-T2 [Pholidichthys leucotaenia]